jgi:hypothetical protein
LAATAKMKIKTSLTDIFFAINDLDTLAELGWNIYDTNGELSKGLILCLNTYVLIICLSVTVKSVVINT